MLVVGGVVILAGLVMLVTPGPGWAALFLGFAIWATEFAFAEKVRDRMIHFLKQLLARGQAAWQKVVRKFKKQPTHEHHKSRSAKR